MHCQCEIVYIVNQSETNILYDFCVKYVENQTFVTIKQL